MLVNPYTPGAGFKPAYLAGRQQLLDNAIGYLSSIQRRYPQQSIIYYGLHGVGKTVLLNSIEETAHELNIFYQHIEASEDGDFINRLICAISQFTHNISISLKESDKDFEKNTLSLLKSFMLTYHIEDKVNELGIQPEESFSTGIFDEDLTDLFVELGKAALKSGDTICLFIDEIQYLSEKEIRGLGTALHRCNQLRLPIMLFGARLPKILKVAGEAERLFKFEKIDALSAKDAKEAIANPAQDFNITYESSAIDYIVDITGGYPYFIQEFCSIVWEQQHKKDSTICLEKVEDAKPLFFKRLDEGFFAVRYNRCTSKEKSFMTAMVRCVPLPCDINNVAKEMERGVRSISPIRGKLINKRMIYPTGYAKIDFTGPQFDDFIKRVNPELKM